MKKTILILAALSFFMGACGAKNAAPSADEATSAAEAQLTGADIQETAVAMAWTMAAETLAAMPTETFTPLPPTATFTPVFTATPVPTATPLFTATPLPTATSEEEIKMLYSWEGASTSFVIFNDTKATASVSIYLVEGTNPRGYYGNLAGVYLNKRQSTRISAPHVGTYCFWAWMSSSDKNWSVDGCMGVSNPDKNEVHLTENGIKFVGP